MHIHYISEENSILNHFLAQIRDVSIQKDSMRFRKNIERIGEIMAYELSIPKPKDDIDGSQVVSIYYEEKNIDRIVNYCEKDVITIAQVVLRLRNEKLSVGNEMMHL